MSSKISALTALTGASTATGDLLPIVDVSAGATKSITRDELASALIGTQKGLPNGLATLDGNGDVVGPIVQLVATEADFASIVLQEGQLAWVSDTHRLVVGTDSGLAGDAIQAYPLTGEVTDYVAFDAGVNEAAFALTDANTVTIDPTLANTFYLLTTDARTNRIISSNTPVDGQRITLIFEQSATSPDRTISFSASKFRATASTLTAIASKRDIYNFVAYGGKWNQLCPVVQNV